MNMTFEGLRGGSALLRPLAAALLLLAAASPAFAVSPDPSGDAAMVGYWKFDEGGGATAADLSANANTASLVNVTWNVAGKFNSAADLNSTDYLDYNDEPELGLTNAVTLSAWVKYRTINYTESGGRIFGHGSNYSMIIGGPFSSSATLAVNVAGTDNEGWHRGRVLLSPNVWYHTAFTYDGSSVTIYVNGVVDSRLAVHGNMTPYTSGSAFSGWDPLAVAGYHAPLDGLVDEVAVYNRALSQGEVAGLYSWYVANSSSPATVSSLSAASGASVGAMPLSWPAPAAAGGGALAPGSSYYIQYAAYSTATWSALSAQVAISTSGIAPAEMQYATISGLQANTTYYFRLWTVDQNGNFSQSSNEASGTTSVEPPTEIYFDVVSTASIVASVYAPSPAFTGLQLGASGVSITTAATFNVWGSSGNYWMLKTAMPTPRAGAAGGVIGGKLYVVGGYNSGYLNTLQMYDPESNTWTTKAPMPTGRSALAVVVVGGKLYALGGTGDIARYDKNEEYDPVSDTWTTKAPMPTARSALTAVAINGKIYAVGGYNMSALAVNEEYDPVSDTWVAKAAMPTARSALASGTVRNKLYVLGGLNGGYLNANEEYDPSSDSWNSKTAMPSARQLFSVGVVGGKLCAVGGFAGAAYLGLNEEYDPVSDVWSSRPAMPVVSEAPASGVINGKLYVTGGINSVSVLASNEVYAPGVSLLFRPLLPNTQYNFKGKARNLSGVETAETPVVSTYTLAVVAPPVGAGFAYVSTSSIAVNWSSGTPSGGFNGPGAAYQVQVSSSSNFSGIVISSMTGALQFQAAGLVGGTTYYFRVRAANSLGVLGEFISLGEALPAADTPPSALTGLSSSAGSYVGALSLSWPAPGSNGAFGVLAAGSSYYIQYSTYPSVLWSTASAQVVRSTSGVVPGTSVRHVIGGLDPGTTYYAAVWHKDEAGNFSAISNIASGYSRQFPGGTFSRTVLGPDRWSLEFNSFYTGDDSAGGSTVDADGNIYVGYHVYNGANTDMALHKLSPDGTLLLEKYFNGEDNCSEGARAFPAVDNSDGSIYLAGHECRTTGPGAGLIIKFDRYGNRLWQRRVVGAGASTVQALSEAEIDPDGYLYVAGTLTNASNNADMYVGKFDRNGNQLWSNILASSFNTEVFNSLVVVGTNVFAGGYSDQGAQSNNAYGRKIDGATGATQWTYSYNSVGNYSDGFTDLAPGPDGSVYFAGQTQVTPGDPDVLMQKRYSDGAVAWTRNYSFTTGFNEPVEGMAAPADGYFYTASMAQTTASNAHIAVTRFTPDGSVAGQLTYTQGVGRDGPRGLISAGPYLFFTGYVVKVGGSTNAYIRKIPTWEVPDPFAPDAVAGLGASALAPDKVLLNWQNPGDDGAAGTLYSSSFSVMHSAVLAFAEDQANWVPGSAQIVVSTTAVEPGALSFVEAGGLAADTTYYFRAWAKDDSGNYGPLSAGATAQTLAYPPAGLAADGVYVSSTDLSWSLNGNPAWTRYEVWRSTSEIWLSSAAMAVSEAGPDFTDTGLAPEATYYYKVRALNGQGVPTAFSAAVTVVTGAGVMAVPSHWAYANGVSSVTWYWQAAAYASNYRLEASTGGPVSGLLGAGTLEWREEGLLPNTPYSRKVVAFNIYGSSSSVPYVRYSRALVPSALTVSAVYVTSAALTWSMGINPEGTVSHVERSTGGISTQVVYEGSATVALAAGLQYCTDYDFAVKALNGDGIGYDYSEVASTRTKDYQALPPSGLSAESLGGGRIGLNWGPSPSPHANLYRLYYDEGDGSVDYSAPLAELAASATSYVTGVLASSAAYTFALRAVNRCGVEETNTHVLASAASVPALASVKASIKEPHSGKKVSGNRLTVIAELTQGEAYQADKVLFQFRAAGGAWGDIIPANANHPNPDLVAPYFVHWDVSGLADGNYDLRAVAYDIYGASDTAPAAITVRVDNADFEVKETLQGDGKVKKEQLITNTITSEVSAADSEKAWVTKVAVPSGAVSVATVTLSITNNPTAAPSADSGLNPVGQATEITLSNGQHLLDNGQTAEVTLTYPDDDGDGVVDGSFIRAERLRIYSYDSSAGAWKADLACRVDKEKRQVIGATPHFSYFAVFAPMAAAVSAARAYPNPWKPGAGGRFDAAAVTFDGLPSDALIQVFTIGGDLVRELRVTAADSGVKTWNGLNTSGSKAASGVYLVLVRANGKTKTFKLGVER